MRRFLLIVAPVLLLAGCGIFGGGGDDEAVPAELVEFQAALKVTRAWSQSLGSKTDGLLLGLTPASNGARVYAASDDGDVRAFDALTGKPQWSIETGLPLSAGPGLGFDVIAVGSSEGDILLLSAVDGKELWRINVGSEVLSPPAVGEQIVVVRSVDGRLIGLSNQDGSEQWSIAHRVQGLTLRGTAAPVISGGAVICGFDDGQLVAARLADGTLLWEARLSEQRGRTALDRLADVDSSVAVVGEDVFVSGYQGSTVLLSLQTGQPVWRQDISSHRDVGLDWNRMYVSTADDSVTALVRGTGVIAWRQGDLSHRQLSGPAVAGKSVAVGDLEGYVHWLDAETGAFVARKKAGKGAVVATPLVAGDLLYVLTNQGELSAFRVGER